MRWLSDVIWRLRAVFDRSAMDRELDDEIRFHIQKEIEKNVAAGMSAAEARRLAHVKFGGVERQKAKAKESWGVGFVDDIRRDSWHAVQQLVRQPAFSVLAILTLALGIGGTVALLGVADDILLRPLPYPSEARLHHFWSTFNWDQEEFDFARVRMDGFDEVGAYTTNGLVLRTQDGARHLQVVEVSAEILTMLGRPAQLGRLFQEGEDRPGSENTVVLSHGLWQQEFGGEGDIIGRRLMLGGEPTTVIGVMPQGFYFPTPEVRAWTTLDIDPAGPSYGNNGYLALMGLASPGASPGQVQAGIDGLALALGERFTYPAAWDKTQGAHAVPLRDYILGDVRPALALLLVAVGMLLLMAIANVSALLVTRTIDRTGELAVRAALGAGRARLARQIVTESVILGLCAGALGAVVALGMFDIVVASLPLNGGLDQVLGLDWTALVAAVLVSVVVGTLVSILPVRGLLSGRLEGDVTGARNAGGSGSSGARTQWALVLSEVGLAVMLVVGATLLVRSVSNLTQVPHGLDAEGVLAVSLFSEEGIAREEQFPIYERLLSEVAKLPGVRSVGMVNRLPIRDDGWQGGVTVEGREDLTGRNRPNAMYRVVTPDYFETMGIEILKGTGLDGSHRSDTPAVTVVSESFAAEMWPGEDPLGKWVGSGMVGAELRVVGVAEEVRLRSLVGDNPYVTYIPLAQARPGLSNVLVVRGTGEARSLVGGVRSVVQATDQRVTVSEISTMDEVLADAMAEPLRLRAFLALFAAFGLMLGTVGVYGVVSYGVSRRRTEFGIRMALGARPETMMWSVLTGALGPVAVGVGLGVVGALAGSRLLAGFLFGVAPTDPMSLILASVALLASGVVASLIPARRALSTPPSEAMRAS